MSDNKKETRFPCFDEEAFRQIWAWDRRIQDWIPGSFSFTEPPAPDSDDQHFWHPVSEDKNPIRFLHPSATVLDRMEYERNHPFEAMARAMRGMPAYQPYHLDSAKLCSDEDVTTK